MKTLYKLLLLLAPMLWLGSCTDERLGGDMLPPGTEIDLQLGMSIPLPLEADVVTSRAMVDAEINRQVLDFCLFIFDEDDRLLNRYYFPSVLDTPTLCDPDFSTGATATLTRQDVGKAVIKGVHTTTGKRRIMGVGNVNRTGASMILEDLQAVTDADGLRSVLSGASNTDANLFVMSGDYEATDGSVDADGMVNITSTVLGGVIRLVPLMSRVRFIIDGNGHEAVGDIPAGKFKLENWQVFNLPATAPLWSTGVPPVNGRIFHSVVREQFTQQVDGDANKSGFSFFTLENNPGEGQNIESYGDRAKWEGTPGSGPLEKEWVNAPPTATFVVIRGSYTGASTVTPDAESDGGDLPVKNVSAKVTYTIFLGHDSAKPDHFNDFSTRRGYNYTYKIKINGVNQISVEVQCDRETRADGEGHIVVSDNETVDLDAHYCQRTVAFNAGQLRSAIENNNFVAVTNIPPLGISRRYNYLAEFADDPEAPEFDWVEAYVHKKDDPQFISYTKARGSAEQKATLTVPRMLDELYKFAQDDANGDGAVITITLYFDEYLYDEQEHGWKTVANSQMRTFSIIGNSKYSADKNSSYTNGGLKFLQHPVRTLYDMNNAGVTRAWGTESIEEPLYPNGSTRVSPLAWGLVDQYFGNDMTKYGRQNNWRQLHTNINDAAADKRVYVPANSRDWTRYIDDATGYYKQKLSLEGNLVCLSRNRDLNGNGKIDADEFRWYMPSIQQLQQLYVCRNVMPANVRLYNPTIEMANFVGNKWNFKHYISSSEKILWAEEGGSTGRFYYDHGGKGDYYVRCVRDMGTYLGTGNDDVPWNIAQVEEAQFQTVVMGYEPDPGKKHVAGRISLERLNPSALRLGMELYDLAGQITTFSNGTAPARSFEWADSLLNDPRRIYADQEFARVESTPVDTTACNRAFGPGWRLPTVSELIVLWWYLGDEKFKEGTSNNPYIMSRTKYHFFKDDGYTNMDGTWRKYHVVDCTVTPPIFVLTAPEETDKEGGVIRCVRDYIPGVQ